MILWLRGLRAAQLIREMVIRTSPLVGYRVIVYRGRDGWQPFRQNSLTAHTIPQPPQLSRDRIRLVAQMDALVRFPQVANQGSQVYSQSATVVGPPWLRPPG